MTDEEAHRYAREKGVSRPLYALVAGILKPLMRLWFRMHIEGADHIPNSGAAILAPNHKSFGDSFFLGVCTKRKLRFMAKTELFRGMWGPVLARLGAFPVKRGEADEDALLTARTILEQDGLLALFPEGTRVRDPDGLGEPKRGAGRIALESGAPARSPAPRTCCWGRSPSPSGYRCPSPSPSRPTSSRPRPRPPGC